MRITLRGQLGFRAVAHQRSAATVLFFPLRQPGERGYRSTAFHRIPPALSTILFVSITFHRLRRRSISSSSHPRLSDPLPVTRAKPFSILLVSSPDGSRRYKQQVTPSFPAASERYFTDVFVSKFTQLTYTFLSLFSHTEDSSL